MKDNFAKRMMREHILPFFQSIKAKMIGTYLLMTLLPMMFIILFIFNVASYTVKNEISVYSLNSIQQANNAIDAYFQQLSEKMIQAGMDPDIQKALSISALSTTEDIDKRKAVSEAIAKNLGNTANIDGAYVFGMNGYCFPYKEAGTSANLSYQMYEQEWFKTMQEQRLAQSIVSTHVMREAVYEGSPLNVVSIIRRITDGNNHTMGFMMLDINIRAIERTLKNLDVQGVNTITVIDPAGKIIYDYDQTKITLPMHAGYTSQLLKEGTGSMTVQDGDNEKAITFHTSANTGWTIISTVPTNILYTRILNFENTLLYTFVLCCIIALTIAVLLSRKMVEPIVELRKEMAKAEDGDFDVSVDARSRDEAGELGRGFNSMMHRIKGLIQRVYQTEIFRKEAELNALQAQINPHFLYNTLQIMDIMAEEKGADEISASCQALAEIFRYSISRGKELVPLRNEIEHIRNYVYILQLRLGDRLNVEYNIKPNLLDYEIIKLIIQPLVENAIVHGVEKSKNKCTIRISARVEKDDLYISVEDTGIGMTEAELTEVQKTLELSAPVKKEGVRGGIALYNVNTRLKLYFSDKYGISIKSKKGVGTKVSIILPARLAIKDGGN